MFKGLRTVIFPSKNLTSDKAFWTETLGVTPYFDEQFYVGFNVGGYELGLDPNGDAEGMDGPVTYWGVDDIAVALKDLDTKGVRIIQDATDVGGGIKTARLLDAAGNQFGIIENPNFKAE